MHSSKATRLSSAFSPGLFAAPSEVVEFPIHQFPAFQGEGAAKSFVLPSDAFRRIIGASGALYRQEIKAAQSPQPCVGHFFHSDARRFVKIDMGMVYLRPVMAFRLPAVNDEPQNLLAWAAEYLTTEQWNTQALHGVLESGYVCNTRTYSPMGDFL